jgi:predicted O-methyltransferase YrrM
VANPSTKGKVSKTSEVVEQLFATADRDFLRSAISRDEGRFLEDLASRPHVQNTIELGCANGISSIFICSANGRDAILRALRTE